MKKLILLVIFSFSCTKQVMTDELLKQNASIFCTKNYKENTNDYVFCTLGYIIQECQKHKYKIEICEKISYDE